MEGWYNLFGWLLSVLTATGNGFVVFLVARNRLLHSPANWLVLSLAVADFGVGIFVFPVGYLCNNLVNCNMRVSNIFYWFLVHSSVTNLCSLAWDRYTAIVHPFKYLPSLTARRHGVVILLVWLVPLAISLSMGLGMYATNSQTAWRILRLTGVSAFDILSCALLFFAIVRILIVTRAQSLQDAAMESVKRSLGSIELETLKNQSSTEKEAPQCRRKKQNTARFIIAIVTFFLGCHVVTNVLVIHIMFVSQVNDNAGWVVTLLLVTNSAVNPFVYAFLKRDIKKEVSQLICRKTRRSYYNSERSSRSTQLVLDNQSSTPRDRL